MNTMRRFDYIGYSFIGKNERKETRKANKKSFRSFVKSKRK